LRATFLGLLAAIAGLAAAQPAPGLPTLEEIEAAGGVIGEIRIAADDIFNLADPAENRALFRLANRLHIQTQPELIRGQLLFRSGEKLVAQRVRETERLLRGNRYLYEASIRPVAWRDGIVDLEVRTRDTWSLEFGASAGTAGGTTTTGARLREFNFLGTGMSVGVSTRSASEVTAAGGSRRAVNLDVEYPYAFDGRTVLKFYRSSFSDGTSRGLGITHPFYSLDTRWAAGVRYDEDDRELVQYSGGVESGRFRRQRRETDLFGAWSAGLQDGWTQRFSLGARHSQERFGNDPAVPAVLPADRTLAGPYFRYEVVEDRYRVVSNVDSIGRPEYQALGLQSSLLLGRGLKAFGATDAVTWYAASVSRGLRFSGDRTLLASSALSGEYSRGGGDRLQLSGALRYYQRRGSGNLLFLSLTGDATDYADATQYLSLGGDTGLRGYPSDYQRGDRRILFTVEQRLYSDWYPFRLIRVGGAVFYDVGRAWGGPYDRDAGRHWPADAGFGLRLLSARSATGTTLHVDFAFALERDPAVGRSFVSIGSKSSF